MRERVSEREKLYTEHRAYKLVTNNRVRTNMCLSRFCLNFFPFVPLSPSVHHKFVVHTSLSQKSRNNGDTGDEQHMRQL